MYTKPVMYQELSKFIGCIKNVRIGSSFTVYLYNALFEFLLSDSIKNVTLASLSGFFKMKCCIN